MSFDAKVLRLWLALAAERLQAAKDYLTELDAAIGDADHGVNIARGFTAAAQKVASGGDDDLSALFKQVGMTLMSSVGGASGMLYGNFFIQAANAVPDKAQLSDAELLAALERGRDGIIHRGRAEAGDKTMVDVWLPAVAALAAALHAGADLPAALRLALVAAEAGRDATIPLQARKGRASYLGERSIGHIDPGAASSVILLAALCDAVEQAQTSGDQSL